MTGWRVWPAGPDDEAILIGLEVQSFGARSWGAKSTSESFMAAGICVLMAGKDRSSAAGFAMWRDLGAEAELLTIGVAPGARRAGLARALLRGMLDMAAKGGAARMVLEVDAANAAARGLYAQAGFEQISVRRAYYRDGADGLVMQKMLSA